MKAITEQFGSLYCTNCEYSNEKVALNVRYEASCPKCNGQMVFEARAYDACPACNYQPVAQHGSNAIKCPQCQYTGSPHPTTPRIPFNVKMVVTEGLDMPKVYSAAFKIAKKAHGDGFSETKTKSMVNGLIKKNGLSDTKSAISAVKKAMAASKNRYGRSS